VLAAVRVEGFILMNTKCPSPPQGKEKGDNGRRYLVGKCEGDERKGRKRKMESKRVSYT
jgi:hypothetical protein